MEETSKYWNMISKDESVIAFNKMYNICVSINRSIADAYKRIYRNCNTGFSNLISGKRILVKLPPNSYDNIVGLGMHGFGSAYYRNGTLDYNPKVLRRNKKFVIKYSDKFLHRVKKLDIYRDMYNKSLNALIKVPDIDSIIDSIDCDIIKANYGNTGHYNKVQIKSQFGEYLTGFDIVLISDPKRSYRNQTIHSESIEQDVSLYHTYDDLLDMMTNHLAKLKKIENKFKRYLKSKTYLDLKDEIEILEVTKKI